MPKVVIEESISDEVCVAAKEANEAEEALAVLTNKYAGATAMDEMMKD